MDTKKYEAMVTSIEQGSFTRAADILGYTQSGLTHMMNALPTLPLVKMKSHEIVPIVPKK